MVLGLGDRAGNAPLEEVALALRQAMRLESRLRLFLLPGLCARVAAGREIPSNRPVVECDAFTHASGVHIDGVLKDLSTYEAFPPEDLGQVRRNALGKHSGRASVLHRLGRLGIRPGRSEAAGQSGFATKLPSCAAP